MANRALIISAAIASVLPSLSCAQEFSGAITLGYSASDLSDTATDVDTMTFDGRFGLEADNGLHFGADISGLKADIDGVSEDVNETLAGIYGGIRFGNGAAGGLYVETAELDIDGLGDVSLDSYGLMAGYEAEGARVSGFYGISETDPDLPAGMDIADFGASFSYTGSEGYTIGASAQRTELSADGMPDIDIDFAGIAGSYAVSPGWTLFGGLSDASIDLIDTDLTTVGFGVSYDLSTVTRANASLSLELARSELEVAGVQGDADTVRLGLSIPLGGRGFTVPMNSVADAVLNPRHNALTSADLSTF